ncbi:MAG TPA: TonB-dependent receptor [Thiopseudomonas sp.]|nr:TonB-dependent receptor [Thiopseudomonas sp.]
MQFKPSKLWASLILGNALLVAAGAAHSQVYRLDQRTVQGQGQETEVFTNPASVTVIDRDTINKSAGQSVASYLRNVPGVQVVEDGLERISIRGESSTRVAIFIDGQKLTDHTEHGQPLLIDPASIERIEVLRGSSSVVSGGRAIGGVVNIVTKKGADKPLEISTQAGYFSATKGYRASTALSGSQAGFDYRLGVSRSELNDRSTPKGRLKPSSTDDSNISAHLGYKIGKHYIAAKAQRYDVAAKAYFTTEGLAMDFPKRELNKVGLFYEGEQLTETLDKLKIDVYRQTIDREFRNNVVVRVPMPGPMPAMTSDIDSFSDDEQTVYGLNTQAELSLIEGHSTVVGLEYEQDRLEAKKTRLVAVTPSPPYPSSPAEYSYDDASINTSSVFVQHSVPLTEDLTASFGARHYYVEAKHDKSFSIKSGVKTDKKHKNTSDNHTVGAMSLVWQASDELVLRTNLSQGYVYPTLSQLFLTTAAGGNTFEGNPDLKPEKSTTFELGARYDTSELLLDATLFYNRSKNYINSILTNGKKGTFQNADKAKSYGVELLAEKSFQSNNFRPYTTMTLMRRKITASEYDSYDSGVPSVFGRVGLKHSSHWNAWEREADLFVQGATSALNEAKRTTSEAREGDGYATLNLRLSLTTRGSNSFGIELNNLTDKTYRPIDEQLYGAKRSVNVFASYTF